jgi:hypothetical protein
LEENDKEKANLVYELKETYEKTIKELENQKMELT